jgi:hypothetical protein
MYNPRGEIQAPEGMSQEQTFYYDKPSRPRGFLQIRFWRVYEVRAQQTPTTEGLLIGQMVEGIQGPKAGTEQPRDPRADMGQP